MRYLFSIILIFAFIGCRSQTIDETIQLLQAQVDALEDVIMEQSTDIDRLKNDSTNAANNNTELLFMVDSLRLVVENLEAIGLPDSILADTFHLYVYDNNGYVLNIHKYPDQINTSVKIDSVRMLSLLNNTNRTVYFMYDNGSDLLVSEDSASYRVNADLDVFCKSGNEIIIEK